MLKKRLFFLLSDKEEAAQAIDELKLQLGASDHRLHVVGVVNGEPAELPELGGYKRPDDKVRRERYLTLGGSLLFVVALIALGGALLAGAWGLSLLLAIVVVSMQLSGYLFPDRPGNAELDRFRDTLVEGNVLLMVDVPRSRAKEVASFVRGHHPGIESGGSGWYIDALGH